MSNENYVAIDREELERLRADSAELARLKEPVAWEYQKAALAEHSNWIRNRTTDQAVEYLWKKGWRIAPEPTPEGFVLVPVDRLKHVHRDLDACQRVIWYAGGFDPSYCTDAQARLAEIDTWISAAQQGAKSHE